VAGARSKRDFPFVIFQFSFVIAQKPASFRKRTCPPGAGAQVPYLNSDDRPPVTMENEKPQMESGKYIFYPSCCSGDFQTGTNACPN
jgi:hypothetical protein